MKHWRVGVVAVAGLAAAVLVRAGEARADCPLPGEAIQWIADYCMQSMQTDDEIAVSGCIGDQLSRRFADDCAAKRHFKAALCAGSSEVREGGRTAASCVADPQFMGPTVRNGGVGG